MEHEIFVCVSGWIVESVLMKYNYGNSVCLNSDRLPYGCFCASAGWVGSDLSAGECFAQIMSIQKDIGDG